MPDDIRSAIAEARERNLEAYQAAYVTQQGFAAAHIETIERALAIHHDQAPSDGPDWSFVGDLAEINRLLAEAEEWLQGLPCGGGPIAAEAEQEAARQADHEAKIAEVDAVLGAGQAPRPLRGDPGFEGLPA